MGVYIWTDTWLPGENTLGYWKLDGNINDELGNFNMTTRVGSMSYGALSGGTKYGIFNGSTILSASGVPNWTKGTISMYIYKSSTSSMTPFSQATDTTNDNHYGQYVIDPSQVYIYSPYVSDVRINYSLSAGVRHNIILTQDGTYQKLFVDGNNVGQATTTNWFNSSGGNELCIGGLVRASQTYNPLTGYLSNLIIENKARTAQEILAYYNSTKSNYGL